MTGKIILLDDVYDLKKRKEEELAYYNDQLEKLKTKMFFIQKEIDVTNLCIELIEQEKVVDLKKLVKDKKN
jgi:hypothetical protein